MRYGINQKTVAKWKKRTLWPTCPQDLRTAGLYTYEFICKQWTSEPKRFKIKSNPSNAGIEHLALLQNGQDPIALRIFDVRQSLLVSKIGQRRQHFVLSPSGLDRIRDQEIEPRLQSFLALQKAIGVIVGAVWMYR